MKPNSQELREYARRRARLMRAIGPRDVAIIPSATEVIRNSDVHYPFRQNSDFSYLTGFPEPDAIAVLAPGNRSHGGKAEFVLFVRPRSKEREIWDGRREGPEGARRNYAADEAFVIDDFDKHLARFLEGRERVHYTLGEHVDLDAKIAGSVREIREISRRGPAAPHSFVSLDTTLHELRLLKTPAEVATMAKACRVSAHAHVQAMKATAAGKWEWQIAAEIHKVFEEQDMEPGYNSIVGGGDNACILHYNENNATLRDGDLLLIDAGGEYRGYTADITRTFPVSGKFSAAQQAVYEVVLEAQKAATRELKPGNSCGKPHETATRVLTEGMVDIGLLKGKPKDLIEQGKQRQFFMHGTGHWLGMDVHDVGRYKLDGEYRPFEAGMVMTVEPGIYIAPGTKNVNRKFWGIGVRIEDDVLVGEKGPRVLTDGVPKEVREIEKLMRQ